MSQRLWSPALAVTILFFAACTAAHAQAAPPGSYVQSCPVAYMQGSMMVASCKDDNGNLHDASLADAWTCVGDISNSNGALQCHGFGPYTSTCTGISTGKTPNGIPFLLASCPNGYGQNFLSLLLAPDSCGKNRIQGSGPPARILNIDGRLRCVVWFRLDTSGAGNQDIIGKTTWSDGSTERTYWSIDQPTITAAFNPFMTISFKKGDTVTLSAEGCAQRGGGFDSGDTWADYTNQPITGEYFGLAFLPGTGQSNGDRLSNPGAFAIGPVHGVSPVGGGVVGINGVPRPVYEELPNQYLTLGYVDDGYGSGSNAGYPDNGYYTHDNGNGNCTNIPPVGVQLEVDHPVKASTAPLPYSVGSEPFDVIFNQLDNNGLPLNPKWFGQTQHEQPTLFNGNPVKVPDFTGSCGPAFSTQGTSTGGTVLADIFFGPFASGVIDGVDALTQVDQGKLRSGCTSQAATVDQFTAWNDIASLTLSNVPICPADPIRGHLNWQPVTYIGGLHFSDYSGPFPQDQDINMILGGQGGLTVGSVQMGQDGTSETYPYLGFLVEFDAAETFFNYFTTPWWKKFVAAALADDRSTAEQLLGNSYWAGDPGLISVSGGSVGVVTGLLGVDGVHDKGISELHPVFSLAAHLPGDVATSTGLTEHWVFFIRNQGNEGSCSAQIHTLEPQAQGGRDYYISLPWPPSVLSTPSPVSVTASIQATPWVSGATVGQTQSAPGVGTYLHFLAPPYSSGEVPFFGFDGEVTLHYTYPSGGHHQQIVHHDEPATPKAPEHSTHAATSIKPEENYDLEDFPIEKIVSAIADPALKAHVEKYLTQKPSVQTTSAVLPQIVESSAIAIVKPKTITHDTKLPQRTHTLVNVATQRQFDDLALAAGYPQRTFQVIDSGHVFILGTDGVLSLVSGAFDSKTFSPGKSPVTTKVVDRGVESFTAVSMDEVLALRDNGSLLMENAPFGGAADGTCVQGFVWRQANPQDHVCVVPATRTQAANDTAAGPSHLAPPAKGVEDGTCAQGYVWREANVTDHACVLPSARKQTLVDNALAPFETVGSSQKKFLGWPVTRFQQTSAGDVLILDRHGTLWQAGAPFDTAKPSKLTKVAKSVRGFQSVDAQHTLILTSDDRLQFYPTATGSAAPNVYENIWAFQQTSDGSLFVIKADDTLWREQPEKQIDNNVRTIQAIDANNIFVLRYDGTLSLRRTENTPLLSEVNALVNTGVRAFQALDAQTVWVLDGDGKLWLERGNFGPEAATKMLIVSNVR